MSFLLPLDASHFRTENGRGEIEKRVLISRKLSAMQHKQRCSSHISPLFNGSRPSLLSARRNFKTMHSGKQEKWKGQKERKRGRVYKTAFVFVHHQQ